jgi:hypothetical protein
MKLSIFFATASLGSAAFAGQGTIMSPHVAGEGSIMRSSHTHLAGTVGIFRPHSVAGGSGHIDLAGSGHIGTAPVTGGGHVGAPPLERKV